MAKTIITKRRALNVLSWTTGVKTRAITQYYRKNEWQLDDPASFIEYMIFWFNKPKQRKLYSLKK
jgi:hypothetical protein